MSFVADQVRAIDLQLDRLRLEQLSTLPPSAASDSDPITREVSLATPRILKLQGIIKSLSSTSSTLLTPQQITSLLSSADISATNPTITINDQNVETYLEHELSWLVVSKAAIQTYGVILLSLVDATLPLSDDIYYWDEVLSSYRYTLLYSLQTSPWRLYDFAKEVYHDARARFERGDLIGADNVIQPEAAVAAAASLSEAAQRFYGLVRTSWHERSLSVFNARLVSPFALITHSIHQKHANISKLRAMQASALGVLMNEGLMFGQDDDIEKDDWKGVVERSIVLMDNVVKNVSDIHHVGGVEQFEDLVFMGSGNGVSEFEDVAILSNRLQEMLRGHLPRQELLSREILKENGRPGWIVRYWIPITAVLLSSGTLLRLLVNRQEAIHMWIREAGETVYEFWGNWVVDPIKRIIGTIRTGEDQEVALMSRESLISDRESLERMVVEFAIDNPSAALDNASTPLTPAEIESIRENVKQGDLTPVLRVYEQDMKKPIRGAVTGELLRSLLIQIQKTKVDVEVAVSGIDNMLKSQQLLFGMLGLTPGGLIVVGTTRWIRNAWGGRNGIKKGEAKGRMVRILRHIDRILSTSAAYRATKGRGSGERSSILTFKEHGLLLCEIHVLRELAGYVLPRGVVMKEFLEDLEEMGNIRNGVRAQRGVVERVRWAYAKWMN